MRKFIILLALLMWLSPCTLIYGEENDEIISVNDFDFTESGQVLDEAGYQQLNVKNIINSIIFFIRNNKFSI